MEWALIINIKVDKSQRVFTFLTNLQKQATQNLCRVISLNLKKKNKLTASLKIFCVYLEEGSEISLWDLAAFTI